MIFVLLIFSPAILLRVRVVVLLEPEVDRRKRRYPGVDHLPEHVVAGPDPLLVEEQLEGAARHGHKSVRDTPAEQGREPFVAAFHAARCPAAPHLEGEGHGVLERVPQREEVALEDHVGPKEANEY